MQSVITRDVFEKLIQKLTDDPDINWGGFWRGNLDYMHFEIPKAKVASFLKQKKTTK